jgi:L,D-transpeptidase YcbB
MPLRTLLLCAVSGVLALLVAPGTEAVEPDLREVRAQLQAAATRAEVPAAVRSFYAGREHLPAWAGDPAAQVTLAAALRRAVREGLDPTEYGLLEIERTAPPVTPEALAAHDLRLTGAFLRYAEQLNAGRLAADDTDWHIRAARPDYAALLERALSQQDVEAVLADLAPPHPGYQQLRAGLERYRSIAARGGWPSLGPGPLLGRGSHDPRVAVLRQQLGARGDWEGAAAGVEAELFDAELEAAVRRFQARHGLAVDGIVGPVTRAALNVPVKERIRQIALNMDRWRAFPRDLGRRHVLVNAAAFELTVYEEGRKALGMRVVVGSTDRPTPVLASRITHLVLNPYWTIPPVIAREDILPHVRRDPTYLQARNIRVYSDWSAGARELDPLSIDWSEVSARRFPYKLERDPGPRNDLGRVQFMMPNARAIFLHDTPDRHQFAQDTRAFSAGCVRLADPFALAAYALGDGDGWSLTRLLAEVETGRNRSVPLPEPLPVYLGYWTAWADEDGQVQFRDDIYGHDGWPEGGPEVWVVQLGEAG